MNSIRWLKQRGNDGCQTLAILNLLKWLGRPVTMRSFSQYRKYKWYRYIFRLKSITIHQQDYPALEQIKAHLATGGLIILRSGWKNECSALCLEQTIKSRPDGLHLLIVSGCTDKSVFCVNVSVGENKHGHCWIRNERFVGLYLQQYEWIMSNNSLSSVPIAFMISRKK